MSKNITKQFFISSITKTVLFFGLIVLLSIGIKHHFNFALYQDILFEVDISNNNSYIPLDSAVIVDATFSSIILVFIGFIVSINNGSIFYEVPLRNLLLFKYKSDYNWKSYVFPWNLGIIEWFILSLFCTFIQVIFLVLSMGYLVLVFLVLSTFITFIIIYNVFRFFENKKVYLDSITSHNMSIIDKKISEYKISDDVKTEKGNFKVTDVSHNKEFCINKLNEINYSFSNISNKEYDYLHKLIAYSTLYIEQDSNDFIRVSDLYVKTSFKYLVKLLNKSNTLINDEYIVMRKYFMVKFKELVKDSKISDVDLLERIKEIDCSLFYRKLNSVKFINELITVLSLEENDYKESISYLKSVLKKREEMDEQN